MLDPCFLGTSANRRATRSRPDGARTRWLVYERQVENGWLVTRCKEHPIYGADRLGMDLNGVEISRSLIEGDPTNPTGDDPAGRHALVIGEILYDSPTTGDDFPTGKEYHEGEYIVLINKSGKAIDLADYQLRVGDDSLALTDTLPAGERVIVGFGTDVAAFTRLLALSGDWASRVVMQNTLPLPDRGAIVRVTHDSDAEIDVFAYGDFYGLNAENLYLADSLIDSLGRRSSLKSVQRDSYGGPIGISGSEAEGSVGNSDPGVDPEPTEKAVVSAANTHRGRKVYELKNHLGNVLAVVSDVKIGLSTSSQVFYYVADVVELTDYEPFGMPLAMRHYVSGDGYRFGFQGQEGDDEWNGEGSMLAFKYRIHDVRLGRFLSIDPLEAKYPWNSTYAFSENKVIQFRELEGAEIWPAAQDIGTGIVKAYGSHIKGLAQTGLGVFGSAWQYLEREPSANSLSYDVAKMGASHIPLVKLGFGVYETGDAVAKGDLEGAVEIAFGTMLSLETDVAFIGLASAGPKATARPVLEKSSSIKVAENPYSADINTIIDTYPDDIKDRVTSRNFGMTVDEHLVRKISSSTLENGKMTYNIYDINVPEYLRGQGNLGKSISNMESYAKSRGANRVEINFIHVINEGLTKIDYPSRFGYSIDATFSYTTRSGKPAQFISISKDIK